MSSLNNESFITTVPSIGEIADTTLAQDYMPTKESGRRERFIEDMQTLAVASRVELHSSTDVRL